MRALLWKECRLATDLLLGTLVLFVASFPLACAGVAMQGARPFPWLSALVGGCVLNQYTMVLTAALLGAVALAREREDGNQAFLAALPVSPGRQWAAKMSAMLLLWFALWGVNGGILYAVVGLWGHDFTSLLPFLPRLAGVGALSFAALGFAALAGNYISRVTGATFAAVGALLLIAVGRVVWLQAQGGGAFFTFPFDLFLGGVGLAGLMGSCVGYLRMEGVPRRRAKQAAKRSLLAGAAARGPSASLFWKDARLLRAPIGIGLFVFLLPFWAAAASAVVSDSGAAGFRMASLLAMALGWVVLPLWGGTGLGSEWPGGNLPFVGGLPLAPGRRILSKLSVLAMPAAFVMGLPVVVFLLAQAQLAGEPALDRTLTWDGFNQSAFLGGAIAYGSAMPVTFATAWYFAARLHRTIVAIVLGVIAGPVAMALWAVTGGPGGHLTTLSSPLAAVGLHASALMLLSTVLIALGSRRAARHQLA